MLQSDTKKAWIINQSDEENPYPDTVYFGRTLSSHVDPILKNGNYW